VKKKILRLQRIVFWLVLVVLVILAFVKGSATQVYDSKLQMSDLDVLNDKWEQTSSKEDPTAEYRYRIGGETEGQMWLSLRTYIPEFEVYLDSELIHKYSDEFGRNGGGHYMIKLPEDASGKMLSIRMEKPEHRYQNRLCSAYLGSEAAIMNWIFRVNLYAMVFAIVAAVFAAGLLIITCHMSRKLPGGMNRSLLYLSVFSFSAGVWVLTDSELLLCITERTAAISLMSFVSFMIMPIYLVKFIGSILERRKSLAVLEYVFSAILVLYLLNYAFPVIPGYWLLPPVHICCAAGIAIILHMGFRKLKKQKESETRKIMTGFAVLSIFCLIAFVFFYADPASIYAVWYCIGMILFIAFLLLAALEKLYKQVTENARSAAYKRLAYLDVMTGLYNKSAFLEQQKYVEDSPGLGYAVFDINGLKHINDAYGHQAGDRLIIAAAGYIRDSFGELGNCFRVGGDEFVVVMESCGEEDVKAAIGRLKLHVERDNETAAVPLSIAAGYTIWQQKVDSPEGLLQRADANMYENKQEMKAEASAREG